MPRDETTGDDAPEYNAFPVQCKACEAIEATADIWAENAREGQTNSHGIRWRVEKAAPLT